MSLPKAFLEKAQMIAAKKVAEALMSIGDACVKEAVENGSYTDRTGNLRSSVGYVVSLNGEVIGEGGFWLIGNGSQGQSIGRSKAVQLASGTQGLALIVVAGMNYAQLVADKGYNVLDSAEILIKKLTKELKG